MHCCRIALGVALSAGLMCAQSMIESAAAAAGGSVAGVAGKSVSDGVDTAVGKLGSIAKKAAEGGDKNKPQRLQKEVPPVPMVRGTLTPQAARVAPVQRGAKGRPAIARAVVPDYPSPAPARQEASAPAPPQPTIADFQALGTGASRGDVVGKLGRPTSRITMADASGLVEIYTYSNNSERLGSVRLVNGRVEEVKPNVQ